MIRAARERRAPGRASVLGVALICLASLAVLVAASDRRDSRGQQSVEPDEVSAETGEHELVLPLGANLAPTEERSASPVSPTAGDDAPVDRRDRIGDVVEGLARGLVTGDYGDAAWERVLGASSSEFEERPGALVAANALVPFALGVAASREGATEGDELDDLRSVAALELLRVLEARAEERLALVASPGEVSRAPGVAVARRVWEGATPRISLDVAARVLVMRGDPFDQGLVAAAARFDSDAPEEARRAARRALFHARSSAPLLQLLEDDPSAASVANGCAQRGVWAWTIAEREQLVRLAGERVREGADTSDALLWFDVLEAVGEPGAVVDLAFRVAVSSASPRLTRRATASLVAHGRVGDVARLLETSENALDAALALAPVAPTARDSRDDSHGAAASGADDDALYHGLLPSIELALTQALDERPERRAEVATALARLGTSASVRELDALLERETDPAIRSTVAATLAMHAGARGLELAERVAANDPSDAVRRAVRAALGSRKEADATAAAIRSDGGAASSADER